ncbi:phytanoyl-CoA dioxygenase family protein [Planktothrix agardhii]|uniref:phytanoyl-CoA dioxygenase family protein n=1 Tax=Planktothrix agardhii TaxID=1160 RepID=UPI00041474F8|nr:phytanoyl-CoA dioxygenase family protein [Planktothrix agardhii]
MNTVKSNVTNVGTCENHPRSWVLNSNQRQLLPSETDIEFYRQQGWYISKPIFSESEIDQARQGIERFYRGDREGQLTLTLPDFEDWTPNQGNGLRINEFLVQQNRQIYQLSQNSLIGAIAALLTGSDQIRLFSSSLYYKPPHTQSVETTIGWHHDRGYWKTCTSENMISAWIPLHDCDESMGTLTMIDGSHLWSDPNGTPQWFSHFAKSDRTEQEDILMAYAQGRPIQKVPMNMKKGQVSFHHCLTFHGSPSNTSNQPRIAIAFHLQDRDNQYRIHRQKNGNVHVHNNDLVCRKLADGRPDYTDPVFCPVLWEGNLRQGEK